MNQTPYNPLDKTSLAESIAGEILSRPASPLGNLGSIQGAGVYVIYYTGRFAPYRPIRNTLENLSSPIYVGKAIPKGGRKGGLRIDAAARGTALATRLRQHATSVDECENLRLADFVVRHLVVDDIWIPLGENVLIEKFKPLWNRAIDGFGNKVPGRRRQSQFRSPWDVLHPGRKLADGLGDSGLKQAFLLQRVADYFAGKELAKLPKAIERQQEEELAEAEEMADDT